MILTLALTTAGVVGGCYLGLNVPAGMTFWGFATERFKAGHAVDDITSGLRRTLDRLEASIEHHSDWADAHRREAAASEAAAVSAQAEAVRAAQAAEKLGALIA